VQARLLPNEPTTIEYNVTDRVQGASKQGCTYKCHEADSCISGGKKKTHHS